MARAQTSRADSGSLILGLMNETGLIPVDHVTARLGMSKRQLAQTVGLADEVFYKESRRTAAKTQSRLKEMLEIVSRVSEWAGGEQQAVAWYRAQPIPAFGGRTAEALVKTGSASALRDYLDHIAVGGYA
jgi:hypothetical protein